MRGAAISPKLPLNHRLFLKIRLLVNFTSPPSGVSHHQFPLFTQKLSFAFVSVLMKHIVLAIVKVIAVIYYF